MRAPSNAFALHSAARIRFARLTLALTVLLAAGLLRCEAQAAQTTLRWDYSAAGAAGFVLYCGASSRSYSTRIDVGNTDTYIIGTLPVGATSFCAVTAYDSSKVESDYSNELSVSIPSAAPVVDFSVSPTSGTAPLTVTFANATSGQVTSWLWDFGDGTTSTAQNPSHVYSAVGSYKPVLTATGPGGTASKTAVTAISAVAPAAPVVSFSASPTSGTAPLSVVFNNTTTGQVTSWAWNFGDGTSGIVKNPTHVYSTAGSFTVTLSATGPGGTATRSSATPIVVATGGTLDGAAPTVTITAPSNGSAVSGTTTVTATASDNVAVVGVQFLLDGAALGAEQTGSAFSLPWSTTTVSNGVHSISARARDAAGNTALAAAVSVTVTNTQPSGLVAAYGFEEGSGSSVADASGNSNKGTLTGGVTWSAQGKFGSALVFNGSDALVSIADASSLRLSTAMTLEAWVNPATVSSTWRDVIFKGDDDYYLEATSDQNSVPAGGGTFGKTYGGTALAANTWTHLAVTYDRVTLRLYVNGVQVSSVPLTSTIAASASPLQIGGDSIYGQYFKGLIDEVRVYNRALSQAEIQADMNRAVALSDAVPPSAPQALAATAVSSTRIDLAWGASTDNVGVKGYRIERCQGAGCTNFNYQVATAGATSFSDTSLVAGTSYTYRVLAIDAAANLSSYSNVASAATPDATSTPDTVAPTVPTGLTGKAASATRVDLAWTASTDNILVTAYRVERCQGASCTNFAEVGTATSLSFSSTALASNISYRFRIRAADAAGNLSGYSSIVAATTLSTTATGLVAAYSFNAGSGSTAADVSGNGNNGTLTGGATWSAQGKYAGALVFNGVSARVDIIDAPSLRLTAGMTLEAWVNPTTVSNAWRDVVYKGNDTYYLTATSTQGGVPAGRAAQTRAYGVTPLPANAWTHLALTYDSAMLRLYINGVQVSSAAYTGSIATSAYPLQIGGDSIYGQYFQGLIDEVRVYNRALSLPEIQADMNTAVSP